MFTSFWKSLVLLGALLLQDAHAQQFLGDVIPNVTYPFIPGSELAYFRVKDPAGVAHHLTLVNYQSLGSTGKRLDPLKLKRAVIIIHGLGRDAGTYMSNMLSALSQVPGGSDINFDTVGIMAPSFPNGDDKNISYPYFDYPPGATKKASGGSQSFTNALVWKGSQWAGGGTNQYPNKYQTVSSYDVLDQLIAYWGDKSTFPNINQIVIAGHSLGAQTVQRYAAVGKPLGLTTPISYWIANPNSLVWLDSTRPLPTDSCPGYDEWRDGLSNYTAYPTIYNTALVAQGSDAVVANYIGKNKAYARGIRDMGDDSSSCGPFTTGLNRHERFFNFISKWPATCEATNSTTGHCDTIDLVNMGHDGGGMMASSAGIARLFSDNFYGDGAHSYDFGWPRIQTNDDPYPNPAYNSSGIVEDTTVYPGNMTYAGCYTDSGIRTLKTTVYDSTSNTIGMCTQACSTAGYSIAGLEYGSQCWCGNGIGPDAVKSLDLACSQPCPGNSSQTCGNSNRLQLYSTGNLTQEEAPSNAEVVGNYYYIGCQSEVSGARALPDASYSDNNDMTLESCAAFCNGYEWFGIEYAGECYCGINLDSRSSVIADSSCSMTCTGNALELCGGPNALTVYQLNPDAPVSTITQGTTPATSAAPGSTNTASSIPANSTCPQTDGQNLQGYQIKCSSDTNIGSYTNAPATNSYLDCVTACNNAASGGCVAWSYVGGTNGVGSGTCWLKNQGGSFTASGSNTISGSLVSSRVSSVLTSTSSASSAATTYANGSTPVVGGVTFAIQNDVSYSGTPLTLALSKRATTVVGDCLRTCAGSTSCAATAFDSNASTCSFYSAFDNSTITTAVGTTFAAVQSRASVTPTTSSQSVASTASLCPSTDGQTLNGYNVKCSADTNIGSYANVAAANSYLDCMTACNAAASNGCVAWTYVGGTNGAGSGTCWLKNLQGSFVSSGSNTISGTLSSSGSSGASSGSSVTSTSASASASSSSATGSLCPSINQQSITDANNNAYTVFCSSDTTVGAFANAQAATSWADCMTVCDAQAGCVAFTYVGGAYGSGSGTCWMKNDKGSTSSAGNNYIAAFKQASVASSTSSSAQQASTSSVLSSISSSSVSSSTASTTASSTSSASPSGTLCPEVNNQNITDSNGEVFTISCSSDTNIGSFANSQAANSYADCMTLCDAQTGCVAFTYVGGAQGQGSGTCWLKNALGNATPAGSNYVAGFLKAVSSSSTSSAQSSTSSVSSSSTSTTTSSSTSRASSSSTSSIASSSSSSVVSSSSSSAVTSSSSSSATLSSTASPTSSVTSSSTSPIMSSSTSSILSSSSSSAQSSSTSSVQPTLTSSIQSSTSQSSSSTTFSTSTTSASSTAVPLPSGFSSLGCFIDGSTRALSYSAGSSNTNTPSKCASTCRSLGYRYAGTEYGAECYCSNTTPTQNATSSDCNMACSGDSSQICGAGNRLSVYVDNTWTQKFFARSTYGTWNLMSCYVDGTNGRLLSNSVSTAGGVNNMTIANCLDGCAKQGLKYCGAEYYQECYGSSSTPSTSAVAGSDPLASGCNYPCTGNSTEACGGSNRILVYINNGTSS